MRTLWGSTLSSVGGHSICPRCLELNLNNRRRTPEPPLCKGRCRAERGGGVVPNANYLSFLLFKLSAFTIPQALSRQLPLPGGAFGIVRTLRACTLPADSISARYMESDFSNPAGACPALRVEKYGKRTAGGAIPPLQVSFLSWGGRIWNPPLRRLCEHCG